jgi:hypothetical protein
MSEASAATQFAASQNTTAWWQRTWFLALLLFTAVLLNNSELVFHTRLHEADDYAANSLQVIKAKHFHETLGNYCRFGFHHPGPAFFYLFAWGEIAFHDVAPVVPTPFNGQLIALYALSAFFFGATVALIAAKLSRVAAGLFVSLSLLFAAWHFGAVSRFWEFIPGYLGFITPWPPCFIVLPFLCFVIASGAVAAGSGKDLPLMTLAGCFLVHGHAAMPLFVVPMTLVAYGALWREIGRTGGRPWNVFRRQHWIAAGTIALFLAPIVIDLLISKPGNLTLIVQHLRTTYGEGKGILQSLFYFLHFGAYAAAPSDQPIPAFAAHDIAALGSFFLLHWRPYAWWLGSILLFIGATRKTRSEPQEITKLRRRICLALIVATGLAVVWGCVQEGPMFDYNALFIFAIYYAWLLVVALSVAVSVERRCPARIQVVGLIALSLAAATALVHERRRFRGATNHDAQRQFAASVEQALILDPSQPKFLNFDSEANGQAERVALYLERRGIAWWVREDWPLVFGEERIIRPGKTNQPAPTLSSSFWLVAPRSNPAKREDDPNAIPLPLTSAIDLVVHRSK